MTNEILNKAIELKNIIDITDKALDNAYKFKTTQENTDNSNKCYYDGLYGMYIGKHRDNSGISMDLCRYTGNAELLDVIIAELERQLAHFIKEYKSL